MEHPIPQDVTHFQFKLIGQMTIKQFAYLAAGAILGWLFLASPLFLLIKLPLGLGFGFLGVILAFIPIEGRPADSMFIKFLTSVFSTNQYVFQKTTIFPTATILTPAKTEPEATEHFTKTIPEPEPLTSAQVFTAPIQQTAPTVPPAPIMQEEPVKPSPVMVDKLPEIKIETKKQDEINQQEEISSLEKELQNTLSQKQALEQELMNLKQQLESQKQTVTPEPETQAPSEQPKPTSSPVRKVMASKNAPSLSPFLTDTPNLITGIVKDPRGNILPNILVEVKDLDGNPTRAFKTNKLGQFASATPLTNGIYTIIFEDPENKQSFDTIELTVDNTILPVLEVTSVDARENLRKELFGT